MNLTWAEVCARRMERLHALVVARDGVVLGERGYHGGRPDTPTNIKSASKSVVSALVGVAIDRGLLQGVDQPIAPLLRDDLPESPDPRLAKVTIGHLLSMQAGLERTSGPYYGRWVTSANWVRDALARPFVDEPGGSMLYSTGSTHLLSAILVEASGRPTLELARESARPIECAAIHAGEEDPTAIGSTVHPQAYGRLAPFPVDPFSERTWRCRAGHRVTRGCDKGGPKPRGVSQHVGQRR